MLLRAGLKRQQDFSARVNTWPTPLEPAGNLAADIIHLPLFISGNDSEIVMARALSPRHLFLPPVLPVSFQTTQIGFVSLLPHRAARHNMGSTLLPPTRGKFQFRISIREVLNVVQAT